MRLALTILITAGFVVPAQAQMRDNRDTQLNCNDISRDRAAFCQVSESRLGPSSSLDIEPGNNGGVSVKGWSENSVLVRARIEAWAGSDSEARGIASQVHIDTAGGRIQATGPNFDGFRDDDRRRWAVSLEIFTPWNTDLKVSSHNGGINISDIRGHVDAQSHNGGVNLTRLAGDVAGETHNGGINVELAGNSWEGRQLEVITHNGGITLAVPGSYSASLEMKTDNGRVNSDIPVNVRGQINQCDLNFNLGSGGALIKATTHNGGIHLKKM
jgi:hypothetical protein